VLAGQKESDLARSIKVKQVQEGDRKEVKRTEKCRGEVAVWWVVEGDGRVSGRRVGRMKFGRASSLICPQDYEALGA
jgi:hypothetical protein